MIKKIIHCSDIHIRNYQRLEEYAEQLTHFVNVCHEIAKDYDREEVRIVISGDILHSKNDISSELITFTSAFLRQLEAICDVIVIAGNHDLIVNNATRKDAISAIFETANFDHCHLLDMALEYQSGCVVDDNITWCVYSIFNDFLRPDIEQAIIDNPENKFIGLFHGMIVGAKLQNHQIAENGLDTDIFKGCHCVMAGDIHKRQTIKRNGVKLVYPGSMIQQTFGESINNHGFVLWDVETMTHEFIDLESQYGLYDIELHSIDDLETNNEKLLNIEQ